MSTATTAAASTLATIDRALHFDTADQDGPGWQPGDPLYTRPRCTPACHDAIAACDCDWDDDAGTGDPTAGLEEFCPHVCHHAVVRQAIELHDDKKSWRPLARCTRCEVGWTPSRLPAGQQHRCWLCGQGDRTLVLAAQHRDGIALPPAYEAPRPPTPVRWFMPTPQNPTAPRLAEITPAHGPARQAQNR